MNNKVIQKWGFGMAPISKRMQGRYDYAVLSLIDFAMRTTTIAEPDVISEVKGMFNRCLRKDQWDWFSVFSQFGSPAKEDIRRIVSSLITLRRCVLEEETEEAEYTRIKLLRSNFLKYLENFRHGLPEYNNMPGSGWIYVLSTKEQPNLLKIGMTCRSVVQRVKEINSATGVLYPLSPRAVYRVENAVEAEKIVFIALAQYRVRADREFFDMPFVDAVNIIETHLG